jgi:hypothetical protein
VIHLRPSSSIARAVVLAGVLASAPGCAFLGFDADDYRARGSGGAVGTGGEGGQGGQGGQGGSVATPTCDDATKNQDETAVDCGGALCGACPDNKTCSVSSDCVSLVCTDGLCSAPACDDGVKNGAETATDCGGSCPCDDGLPCGENAECKSGKCEGTCQPPDCFDGVKNGGEGGVDCGFPCAALCADGTACTNPENCTSLVCAADICQPAACDDLVRNADETDVDCGGPTCAKCADLATCALADDCVSGVCDQALCQAPTCLDLVANADETDVDCGGPSCAKCADLAACLAASDCVSGVCDQLVCQAPTCSDGVKNGSETALDCGGGSCGACLDGAACAISGDCQSGVCSGGTCSAPSCTDLVKNGAESDVDCGGPCAPCLDGGACNGALDCVSGACTPAKTCGVWSGRSAGVGSEFMRPGSLAPWSDGGLVLVGRSGSVDLDLGGGVIPQVGSIDGFVARYARTGQLTWAKRLGSSQLDDAAAVATSPGTGRIAVAGLYYNATTIGGTSVPGVGGSEGFVSVLDATGAFAWTKAFANAGNDELLAVAFTPGGDVVVAGRHGAANGDVLVARLQGANGNLVWQRIFTGNGADFAQGVTVDGAGNVVVVGTFGTVAGDTLALDATTLTSAGDRDGYVAKLDGATGSVLWAKAHANPFQADGISVVTLANSNDVIYAGTERGAGTLAGGAAHSSTGEFDVVVGRLASATGAPLWSTARGSTAADQPHAVAIDTAGRVVLTGVVGGVANFGTGALAYKGLTDAFVVRVNAANGATLSAGSYGGSEDDYATGLAISPFGNVFVGGWGKYNAASPLDFGDGPKPTTNAAFLVFWASLGSTP